MKIPDTVRLKKATYLTDYVIRFVFTDGRTVDLDFHPLLNDEGQNPMTRQFLDVTRFKAFKVVNRRDIIWGDHEMAFPLATLYAGDFRVHWDGKKYPGPAKWKSGSVATAAR